MSTERVRETELLENTASESWRGMMVGGILLAIIGVLAILFPFVTGVSLSILLGAALVVGSLVHLASAFSGPGWKGFIVQGVLAVVYAVAGISLMANPVVGLATLTILVAAFLFVDGIFEIAMGIRVRPEKSWGSLVISGLLALVLAGLVWASLPSSAAWAIGLLFGVNLLFTGISMAFVAMGGREAARTGTRPPEGEPRGA
jgi:uncharacterized membrane protein HdeD (DUF308 family)